MSSASRRMVFNTRERAVSNDHNRLQAFLGYDFGEAVRWWMFAETDERFGNGASIAPTGAGTPTNALILNGLLVRPQAAPSLDLRVDAGAVWMVDTNVPESPDDSYAKLVFMDEYTTSGVLTFDANLSASPRVDVVECFREDFTDEQSNRDIYDAGTQLFTSQSAPKVIQARLVYSIRRGTAGAGVPANQTGFLPLAVAVVPPGATSWDDCTFWDVRPLVSDRVNAPFAATQAQPRHFFRGYLGRADDLFATPVKLTGQFESSWKSARTGGFTPSAGFAVVDLYDPTLAARAVGYVGVEMVYLYAAFPAGLPRWMRYDPATREPAGFRGVPVISETPPSDTGGAPSGTLALPAALGLSGTVPVSRASMVMPMYLGADFVDPGTPQASRVHAAAAGDDWVWGETDYPSTPASAAGEWVVTTSGLASEIEFTLTAGRHYPLGATEVEVEFAVTATKTAEPAAPIRTLDFFVTTHGPDGSHLHRQTFQEGVPQPPWPGSGTITVTTSGSYRVPIHNLYPGANPATVTVYMTVRFGSTNFTDVAPSAAVRGYRLP